MIRVIHLQIQTETSVENRYVNEKDEEGSAELTVASPQEFVPPTKETDWSREETSATRSSKKSRREPQRLLVGTVRFLAIKLVLIVEAKKMKYNVGGATSSSESDDEIAEKAPPYKRIGLRLRATAVRKKPTKKVKTISFSSDHDTSDEYFEEENLRAILRRAVTATFSYKEDKEDSDDKTDS